MRALVVGLLAVFLFLSFHLDGAAAAGPDSEDGGRVVLSVYELPASLNPFYQVGSETFIPSAQLFAAPLRLDAEGRPQPYLAERWEMSADKLSFTLHLRHDALFHDGTPVTAADVAFSLMALKKYSPLRPLYEPIDAVDTPDKWTAIIRLVHPHPALVFALAPPLGPVLPRHIYGTGKDLKTLPENLRPVGSGPFRFSHRNNDSLVLERFEGFFIPGRPRLKRLEFKVFPAADSDLALGVAHGQVDVAPFFHAAKPGCNELLTNTDLKHTKQGYQGLGTAALLAFNTERKPLDDVRVRRAIAYAFDRLRLVRNFDISQNRIADSPLNSDSPFYNPNIPRYPVDVAKANALLDEAGYPRGADGVRFTLVLDYMPVDESLAQMMDLVAYQLARNVGIDARVRHSASIAQWARQIASGDFQVDGDVTFNWLDPIIGMQRIFHSRNIVSGTLRGNVTHYRNAEVDGWLDEAARETDTLRRKLLYARVQEQVMRDLPVLPVADVTEYTFYDKHLQGIDESLWGTMGPLDGLHWSQPTAGESPR